MIYHIVKPGESVWSIVVNYGLEPVSKAVNQIFVANKLWRVPYISVGQTLIIPVENLYYVIKPGDSLWAVGKRFNIPINQLIAVNNITNPSMLTVGTVIRFPTKAFNPGRYLICIDPGHQRHPNTGVEPVAPGSAIMKQKVSAGTQGIATGKPEYQLNLEVSLKVAHILGLMGYNVIMTRMTNDVDMSNIERAQACNSANATLGVRIHADSSLDKNINGISVQYPAQNAPNVTQTIYEKSKLLAESLLENLVKETGANSRGTVPRTDITGFNWSTIPVALVEMGFMSNAREDIKMSEQLYQFKLAEGISEGIEKYLQTSA